MKKWMFPLSAALYTVAFHLHLQAADLSTKKGMPTPHASSEAPSDKKTDVKPVTEKQRKNHHKREKMMEKPVR